LLPSYFPDSRDLVLLKVAGNPITSGHPKDFIKQREVQGWIKNIKRQMFEKSNAPDLLTQEPFNHQLK
jgi:hypothetical protein